MILISEGSELLAEETEPFEELGKDVAWLGTLPNEEALCEAVEDIREEAWALSVPLLSDSVISLVFLDGLSFAVPRPAGRTAQEVMFNIKNSADKLIKIFFIRACNLS